VDLDRELRIVPFEARDQDAVRRLVLDGLVDRWGSLDPTLNRDLDDIAATYAAGVTLVGWIGADLVGTGTLVLRAGTTGEIVRMSVRNDWRRRGVGGRILDELVNEARRHGLDRVVLETSADWQDAVRLYGRAGFARTHYEDGDFGRDAFFELMLR
jgi:ribosomal protein S18 acetylase RimI-like enzyme